MEKINLQRKMILAFQTADQIHILCKNLFKEKTLFLKIDT